MKRNGWVSLRGLALADLQVRLEQLGSPQSPTLLAPSHADARNCASLSSLHGHGAFPFHTDGAARRQPPSFVALWSSSAYETATLLLDGADPRLAHPVFGQAWLVTPGPAARSFYAVPRLERAGTTIWRLNPDCMRPARSLGSFQLAARALASVKALRITWHPNDALVLDNRRMLHAREPIAANETLRELTRIVVVA